MWKLKKNRLSLFKKKKGRTASHVVSAQKEKLDAAVRSRIVWGLKHGELGVGVRNPPCGRKDPSQAVPLKKLGTLALLLGNVQGFVHFFVKWWLCMYILAYIWFYDKALFLYFFMFLYVMVIYIILNYMYK